MLLESLVRRDPSLRAAESRDTWLCVDESHPDDLVEAVPARSPARSPVGWGVSTLVHPPLSYFPQEPPWLRYTLPSRPAYTSPLPVRAMPLLLPAPGPLRVIASPPPLPWVTRVVAPVRLLVTRDVLAHWSPRATLVDPQLP